VGEPALRLAALNKRFGGLVVTADVSLDVRPGEIHALIGPNGAGKTTLIGQIAGSLHPDSGRIFLGATDVTAFSVAARARLGLSRSFQVMSLLPGFSALENVAVAVQAKQGSSFRIFRPAASEAALNRAALQALERVGLAHRATAAAASLAHGEKRQLELAIALAQSPKLLLLDEPLAGTGAEEAAALVALLQTLRGGPGVLLVEHDMQAVFALADRITVLAQGRVIASGAPAAVRADPAVQVAYLGDGGEPC